MPLTMPEEILLLMLDDETGRLQERAAPSGDFAIAGAVLAELALAGRIDTDPNRLYVVNPAPTGDALQDRALAQIAAATDTQDSRHWIETLAADADEYREALFARLVSKGILKRVEGRFLWVFPERRYPVISDKEEREVKARIMGVLFNDEIPDPRDSMLIGLCRAGGLFSLLLSSNELDRVQARIDSVADLEELNRSLADAIREIYAQIARYAPMV
ncbi:GPP34 family phosphoprotein [Roseomonas stagni]|uniref:GPP34 family phosphoprotein n=1 Tax=Falsiroseomonas algicola TaxID=2716930 RepID=A0A6M1LKA3_9PROT|nr:GPP34 family phosphoprotein [Falsiroseomonas algicola]NGM20582.1 GPP34 family phosphoprotein [Falsiroseomonas algicola]